MLSTAVGLLVLNCEAHDAAADDGSHISVRSHAVLNQIENSVNKIG